MAKRRLGQILVDLGYLNEDQLWDVLEEQKKSPGELLGQVVVRMGLATEAQLSEALAEQWGMQVINLKETTIPPKVLELVPETMASIYKIMPISLKNNVLTVAMADPQNIAALDDLRNFLGYDVRGAVASPADVQAAIERYYADRQESIEDVIAGLEIDEDDEEQRGGYDLASAEEMADAAPIRKLLNMVLLLAIKDHARDIHFEPFEEEFRIRIKADGVLFEMVPPPRHLAFAITTRIKVMANLDIAERRLPQDGRIELTVGGHNVDLRVSVLPTMFGESVVCRVLDRSVVSLDLNNVGMDAETMAAFRKVIAKPNGIILVTGPTGSGKTTTLYSALSELNHIEDKLITTEDPVEYDIDGIVQIPIDHDIGVTFASALRAILRQDPDKILVGEIRDIETAEIAVQASLTGHTVFSTLHTNDAPSTVTRMKDMGVPTFLITATVEAILAQRLVRRICPACKEEVEPTDEQLYELSLSRETLGDRKFFRGSGCNNCNNTGYKGRIGMFELMVMDDELREMIMNEASADELRQAAKKKGMRLLRDAGEAFIYEGKSTAEEVIRETILES